jgi:hypothetical protein
MTEPTTSITDVFPEAVRIKGADLRVGDTVFDTFGGKHVLTKVRHYKHVAHIVRVDGGTSNVNRADTITVIRKNVEA